MPTRQEAWTYRAFKKALDESYQLAIANIAIDGEASVNWIKRDAIERAYMQVWPEISKVSASTTITGLLGTNTLMDTAWIEQAQSYVKRNLEDRIVEVWSESKTQYTKALREATEAALDQGLGVEQTQRRIRTLVNRKLGGDINIWRARRIAQTELVSATNYGTHIGQREAVANGAMIKKQWLVRSGAKNPRHELCSGLDGQTRDVDKDFDVCGEPLMYPGDPKGSAGNTINCRCVSIAVIDTEII